MSFFKLFKKKCKGVAALEFALVFPILFLMLYGILSYSLIFTMQHSLSLAAAEGGRAAVRFVGSQDVLEVRINAACNQVKESLNWLSQVGVVVACPGIGGNGLDIKVNVEMENCPVSNISNNLNCLGIWLVYDYERYPLIPKLLPTPKRLTGNSFTQISLSY